MTFGRGHFRPMPEDFEEHATETIKTLIARYHTSQVVAERWKEICGTAGRRERPVVRTDAQGNERRYPSIAEAARCTRYGRPSSICSAIRRGGTSAGYWWRYGEADV